MRVAAAMLGKEATMHCSRAWGAGSDPAAQKRLEATGRDDRVLILLSPVFATSLAEAFFFPFCPFPGLEPAAWA